MFEIVVQQNQIIESGFGQFLLKSAASPRKKTVNHIIGRISFNSVLVKKGTD